MQEDIRIFIITKQKNYIFDKCYPGNSHIYEKFHPQRMQITLLMRQFKHKIKFNTDNKQSALITLKQNT